MGQDPVGLCQAIQSGSTERRSGADAGATRHVGTNGGTAAGFVGSYETVAVRLRAFHAAGIELFMLQFQPFEAEMRRFAEAVLPRVC